MSQFRLRTYFRYRPAINDMDCLVYEDEFQRGRELFYPKACEVICDAD